MEKLQNRIEADSDSLLKWKLINYYEESRENINFKTQLVFAVLHSIKEDNQQFLSKSKKMYF
jgi:hypothetical protein